MIYNINCYLISLIYTFTWVKTGFDSFHQNMLEIELKTISREFLLHMCDTLNTGDAFLHWHRAHQSQWAPDEARWSLLWSVEKSVCRIWKVNSVWRVETTSLTYYAASSSDLGHINFLVNSLIIISITAPPQINITSLINADMCDLPRWVMEECLDLILLKLISLFFCLFENTFSLESRIQAEWVLVGVLTHSVTSRCQAIAPRGGKKRPDEINAGCWLLQFHGNPHCHPKRLCTDWDICKLSSPINVCLFRRPLPVSLSRRGCGSCTSTVGESIKSQCCCRAAIMVADEWRRTRTS